MAVFTYGLTLLIVFLVKGHLTEIDFISAGIPSLLLALGGIHGAISSLVVHETHEGKELE